MHEAPNIQLVATHGLVQGQSFDILDDQVTFGRTEQCDVVLAEHAVSRQHARIFFASKQLWIVDLGSKNGTLINGTNAPAHQDVALAIGDVVQVGSTIFKVVTQANHHIGTTPIPSQEPSPLTDAPGRSPSETALQKTPSPFVQKLKTLKLPPINKRVILYGSMVAILILLMLSSTAKKQKQQDAAIKPATRKQTLGIPEQFQNDDSQPQHIPNQAEVELLFSQAQSAIRFEDYHNAIRKYQRILMARPEDEKALAYLDIAKKNLYRKIQVQRDIALIEVEKLNFEKARHHWQLIAELTEGFDPDRHNEALERIESLTNMIESGP